jgi:hypothetical protein
MGHINDLIEQRQRDSRPTLVVTDEGHIITTNPLLAPYVVKVDCSSLPHGATGGDATACAHRPLRSTPILREVSQKTPIRATPPPGAIPSPGPAS